MLLSDLEKVDSSFVVPLGSGQMGSCSVLPGKRDGTCGVWYGSIKRAEGNQTMRGSESGGITGTVLRPLCQ